MIPERKCPLCGQEIKYSCHTNYKTAEKKNSPCRKCWRKTYENSKSRKGNLTVLLQDIPEKWYWLGFLLADGHFYEKGCIKLTLAIKDLDHLKRFAQFVGNPEIRVEETKVELKVMHKEVVKKLQGEFGICNRKTYHPPDVSNLSENQLLPLLVGFIDGDGYIGKRKGRNNSLVLTVKCHKSWVNFLSLYSRFLPSMKVRFYKDYAYTTCTDTKMIQQFSQSTEIYHLPKLKRKWEKTYL